MSDKPSIIIKLPEPVSASWLRDGVSFGLLIGTAWVCNTQMPPSGWINAAIAVAWILWLAGKGIELRITKTPGEARAWLDEHHPASRSSDRVRQ